MMVLMSEILEVFQGKSSFPQQMCCKGILWFYFVADCLGNGDHEIWCFILEVRKGVSRMAASDLWRTELGLSRRLVKRVLLEALLKGKGAQKDWISWYPSGRKSQKAQEQVLPCVQRWAGGEHQPGWAENFGCNSGKRGELETFGRRGRQLGRATGMLWGSAGLINL